MLKTFGKQAQSKKIECCFYTYRGNYFVVRFDSNQSKVRIKSTYYDTIRSNLSISRDFYESQATLSISRDSYEKYWTALWGQEKVTVSLSDSGRLIVSKSTHSQTDYMNAWTTDEEYEYDPMKSTSARDVFFKRDILNAMQGYRYIAFSKDKSSFIMWFEEGDNLDGVIIEKREYKRVLKEELLPKAVNYDFLNE